MSFSLFAALSGGSALWSESQSVSVASGAFNVSLGTGTLLTGVPLGSLAFDAPYYLEVTAAAETLSPRVALSASPYAFRATSLEPGGTVAGFQITATGNITLPAASTASVGNIFKGPNRFIHNFGAFNTFIGESAGNFTMTGGGNTATGTWAFQNNTTGGGNTANGAGALLNNTTGFSNTATGENARSGNTIGNQNTAIGNNALFTNFGGNDDTASGARALENKN